jgi:glycosyltransferase involved in cell wall biosynthesis
VDDRARRPPVSVVVYAPFTDASTFYRLTEPARVTGTPVVDRLPHVGDASTVVLNRPLEPGIAEQIRLWREEGRRVVVDLDDCFDTVSPNHAIHGRYTTEHLHSACKAASLVTCSTPALVERYGYGHGVVLRNRIPESRLSVVPDGNREPIPWVGWYGSIASHPDDPAVTGGGVGAAMRGTNAQFTFIGPKDEGPKLAGLLGLDEVNTLGFYSMKTLPRVVAEFDVGIVPLDLSPFNEAKSALKGLEMAAVGVPVIASPTSEYRRMADQEGCALAYSDDDWFRWVRRYLRHPEMAQAHGLGGKEWAATQTYERHADEWRTAWYSAVND